MFDVVGQLVDSAPLPFDVTSAEDVAVVDVFVCAADLETEVPRPLDAVSVPVPVPVPVVPFPPVVEVPRDFFVGGSSRAPFTEFRLPWDGLLLFSDLERLLDIVPVDADDDWLEGIGELFTGTRRRRPIVAVAIIPSCRI